MLSIDLVVNDFLVLPAMKTRKKGDFRFLSLTYWREEMKSVPKSKN
jgi:hypothetical protein